MNKTKELTKKAGKLLAAAALKTGVASSNSACRFGYYQNKVPAEMMKFKK